MKFKLIGSWLMLTCCLSLAADVTFYEGAVCDKAAGFCADRKGVSLEMTQRYLGDAAKVKLEARIEETGRQYFDGTRFTMTGGLTCHIQEQQCWTSRLRQKRHAQVIQLLFGK